MSINLEGKTCLITGGTNGLGKSTALALAKMGAAVVIVGRDALKTARVVEEIRTLSGNQNVDSVLADLSSQAEVRSLADEFKRKYHHQRVLVNNAGAAFTQRQLSVDGIEMTFALNHLAGFLLTNLLLDTMKASAPARIINVSSGGHTAGKIEFDNLQGEQNYGFGTYLNSKLANILFTTELARRLEDTHVTVNALDPGLTATGFGTNNGKVMAVLVKTSFPYFHFAFDYKMRFTSSLSTSDGIAAHLPNARTGSLHSPLDLQLCALTSKCADRLALIN